MQIKLKRIERKKSNNRMLSMFDVPASDFNKQQSYWQNQRQRVNRFYETEIVFVPFHIVRDIFIDLSHL